MKKLRLALALGLAVVFIPSVHAQSLPSPILEPGRFILLAAALSVLGFLLVIGHKRSLRDK
jgi:hypothetical protein